MFAFVNLLGLLLLHNINCVTLCLTIIYKSMKKNPFQLHFVYKCPAGSVELYHDILSDKENPKDVADPVYILLQKIIVVGSFTLRVSPIDISSVFRPSFNTQDAARSLCFDALNMLAGYEKK